MTDIYPFFQWVEQRGALFLNARLPMNYQEKIPRFYKSGGKEKLEKLAEDISKSMEDIFGRVEIKLRWGDKKEGLTGVSIGSPGGIYLNQQNRFQEHNLGTKTSLMTAPIIINYINELLKI